MPERIKIPVHHRAEYLEKNDINQ